LPGLSPEDVTVEFYFGPVDRDDEIIEAEAVPMQPADDGGDKGQRFTVTGVPCRRSGRYGFSIRVLPAHPDLVSPFLPGFVTWAGEGTQEI
jgi:starch phosphorylase